MTNKMETIITTNREKSHEKELYLSGKGKGGGAGGA